MSDAKDKLKAAAWQLASEKGKAEAIKVLREIASEIEKDLWGDCR